MQKSLAHYHLPGLFSFYEFYRVFLPLYRAHRDYFYDWCDISSIYGAPMDCLWGGGRVEESEADPGQVLALVESYGISARLTLSNSLLQPQHLKDLACNRLCRLFSEGVARRADFPGNPGDEGCSEGVRENLGGSSGESLGEDCREESEPGRVVNGAIVHSDLLTAYLRREYPDLYLVSSTTKVLTDFADFQKEAEREEFQYIVPDFRLNKSIEKLEKLDQSIKDKVELLCNECCPVTCPDRRQCYEAVSLQNLGEMTAQSADISHHHCHSPHAAQGYRFSRAMQNPSFISTEDIQNVYLPAGFSNFKIEGRGLGSALLLEFILYYMTKPAYQLVVREEIYLENTLDLF